MEEERTQSNQLPARVVLQERSPGRHAPGIGTRPTGRPTRDPPGKRLSAPARGVLAGAAVAASPTDNHATNMTVSARHRSASSWPDKSGSGSLESDSPGCGMGDGLT